MMALRIVGRLAGRGGVLVVGAIAVCLAAFPSAPFPAALGQEGTGRLEANVTSPYSHIRVRRTGNVRTLLFVRDSGEEVVESMVDLDRPHELLVDYTKYLFLSYVFRPQHEKVLIIGLGGGSMVHFLKHYDPKVKVDVVEIDKAVVGIAAQLFQVRSEGNVNIITQDAFEYFKTANARYDVVYMDAFLKPSGETDNTGVPLRLKTIRFYKEIQSKLTPDGLVAFNINPHPMILEDVKTIKEAFPQTYVFNLPSFGGLVVVGSMAPKRVSVPDIRARAAALDGRFKTTFSFRLMATRLGE